MGAEGNPNERRGDMRYSFTCQPDGVVLSTEANSDAEALTKLVKISKKHIQKFHKDQKPMSDAESNKFIQSVWRKG
jgi:hypothetical protein